MDNSIRDGNGRRTGSCATSNSPIIPVEPIQSKAQLQLSSLLEPFPLDIRAELSSNEVAAGVSDELLLDILRSWESWTNKSKEFYSGLGVTRQTMANMIKKAKKLSREGAGGEFKEMNIESILGPVPGVISY